MGCVGQPGHRPDAALPQTGVDLPIERLLSAAFITGPSYGTRASTIVAVDDRGQGFIHERRFGPNGLFQGETRLEIPERVDTPGSCASHAHKPGASA